MSNSKLGGLPTLSEDQTVTLQPAPVVTFDNATQAFNQLAESASALADTGFGELSKQQGEQAVTRDASGNIQYKSPGLLSQVTGTQAAYEQAAKARYISESALDVQPKVAKLKGQFAGNPDGFRTALDQYTGSVLTATPSDFQPAVRAMVNSEGANALASITAEKQKSDIEDSKNSQFALWTSNVNQLYAMARSQQVGSPDYNRLLAQAQAVETSLKANPAINLKPEELAKFDALVPNLKGEATVSHAAGLYDSTKDEGQAEQYLSDHLNDPSLGISDEEAHTYLSRGLAEIRTRHALSRQDEQQAQYEVEYAADDAYKLALTQGPEARQAFMSDQQIRAAYPKNQPHAEQIIERLNQAGMVYQSTNALRLASPAQAQAYLAKLDPRNVPAPKPVTGGFDKAWQFTLKHEGGYAAHDANGAPVNFGINQAAHPGVDVKNLTPDQAKQIAKSGYWDKIGGDNLSPAMQAAAFDTAYIFGPTAAEGMVSQSGGDPQKLIDIRAQHMQDMIAKDPAKFGKFQKAWDNRNNDLRSLASGGSTIAPDYAARANNFVAAQAAYQNIKQQLHSDPASYVIQNVPGISAQLSSKDPATFQSGLRAMITNQKAMGVAVPSVLTNSQKQMILGSFSTPPEGMSKAQNTLNMLNQLQGTYGQYYPQAMGELSKGGKLPADVTGLDWVKGGDPVVANRMSDAVNTGRETLSKLIPDGGNQLKNKVIEGLSDFNSTLKGPGGSDVASQMAQSVMLYAMKLKAEGGSAITVEQAATQAVKDIVGDNFHMAETYRVPVHIDAGAVAHGVNVLTRGLSPSNVEPFVGAKGVTFQHRQEASASILKNKGVWLTQPNNSGLYLAWPAENGYAQARNPAGQPIQYTWAQLQAASQTGKITEADVTAAQSQTSGIVRASPTGSSIGLHER